MERIYIHAVKSDWSGPEEKVLEESYYGPFNDEADGVICLNDAFGDSLEVQGHEVVLIGATDEEMKDITVNSREFWVNQLAQLKEDNA